MRARCPWSGATLRILAPPMGQNVTPRCPELTQANLSARRARQQRNLARQARRMVSPGAGQPATGFVVAGQPAAIHVGFAAPSSRDGTGEATFARQRRARQTSAPPITSDDEFTKCAICLE
eukprot:1181693-Pyramimonas_sp.AAC.1